MTEQGNRDRSLDAIRATYDTYEREGRSALWDRANAGYRRLGQTRDAALLDLVRQSLSLPSGGCLLDVGCGTGGLAALVDSEGLSVVVTGVDLLPERLAIARERVPSATFVLCSADEMPFDTGGFDLTAAVTLFSSLPSQPLEMAVAREIDRVVRPRGRLIWYDIRYRNPWNPGVHGISQQRLHELFPGWLAELRSFSLLPPTARRLGRSTPITYPALDALPPLRSHLIGRLRKPG